MATLNSAKRNTSGRLDAGYKSFTRTLDFVVDLSSDVTMGTATDVINLATLPAGAIIESVIIQQVSAGTGTGTLVGRVGTTTLTATLLATDPVGTIPAVVPAALPAVVPLAGAELNLLGATAVRVDGKVRVVINVANGDRSPKQGSIVARDATA